MILFINVGNRGKRPRAEAVVCKPNREELSDIFSAARTKNYGKKTFWCSEPSSKVQLHDVLSRYIIIQLLHENNCFELQIEIPFKSFYGYQLCHLGKTIEHLWFSNGAQSILMTSITYVIPFSIWSRRQLLSGFSGTRIIKLGLDNVGTS